MRYSSLVMDTSAGFRKGWAVWWAGFGRAIDVRAGGTIEAYGVLRERSHRGSATDWQMVGTDLWEAIPVLSPRELVSPDGGSTS